MSSAKLLAEQMRRMARGEAWHGPSLAEVLSGVAAEVAFAHPIAGVHSIAEIVHHLVFTQQLLNRRLGGEPAQATEAEFFPAVTETTDSAWGEMVERLLKQEDHLIGEVESLSEERLTTPIMPGGSTVYETFHGHVQHNAYHAGQMQLLKRAAAR